MSRRKLYSTFLFECNTIGKETGEVNFGKWLEAVAFSVTEKLSFETFVELWKCEVQFGRGVHFEIKSNVILDVILNEVARLFALLFSISACDISIAFESSNTPGVQY